jgi:hypothetical protein
VGGEDNTYRGLVGKREEIDHLQGEGIKEVEIKMDITELRFDKLEWIYVTFG